MQTGPSDPHSRLIASVSSDSPLTSAARLNCMSGEALVDRDTDVCSESSNSPCLYGLTDNSFQRFKSSLMQNSNHPEQNDERTSGIMASA